MIALSLSLYHVFTILFSASNRRQSCHRFVPQKTQLSEDFRMFISGTSFPTSWSDDLPWTEEQMIDVKKENFVVRTEPYTHRRKCYLCFKTSRLEVFISRNLSNDFFIFDESFGEWKDFLIFDLLVCDFLHAIAFTISLGFMNMLVDSVVSDVLQISLSMLEICGTTLGDFERMISWND